MPGVLWLSRFSAGRPCETHKEQEEENYAGHGHRGSHQKKIGPEPSQQPGYQLQDQVHTQSVAELAPSNRRTGNSVCAKDSGMRDRCGALACSLS